MEKYSVLMSVYDKEDAGYLKQSMDSILHQTLLPAEFVIICDGKLNEALDRQLLAYRKQYPSLIRIYRLKSNMGLGTALRFGLTKCSCPYVARMDSDDISLPERCRMELKTMLENDLDLVGSAVREFKDDIHRPGKLRITPENREEIIRFSKKRNPFNHPSVMFRKEAVLAAGNYRNYRGFEDYDLWIRMLEGGAKVYNIQKPLVFMRADDSMYARRGGFSYVKQMAAFKKSLYDRGYLTFPQFIYTTLPHVLVGLMPNKFRVFLYKKVLRKS